MACLRMLRRVEEVSPGHPLCHLIRTRILVLRDFAVVISDIMTGLFDMTSNIRELIISDQRPEALLPDTHHDHQALLRLLGCSAFLGGEGAAHGMQWRYRRGVHARVEPALHPPYRVVLRKDVSLKRQRRTE